jgi:hypothetical protein
MSRSSQNRSDDNRCLPEPSRQLPVLGPLNKKQRHPQVAAEHVLCTAYCTGTKTPSTWSEGHSERLETCLLSRELASVSQGCAVYVNNGIHNRPALALLEVKVCVVGGFPFNLVILTGSRVLITIDQPCELIAMQALTLPASLMHSRERMLRTCLSSTWWHGASIGTRNS